MEQADNTFPTKTELIEFHDVKVQMYYNPNADPNGAAIIWRARNPDNFYQGPAFLNLETGKVTYPEGAIVPEYNARDHEIMPQCVVTGKRNLEEHEMKILLDRLESQHKLRNGLSEDDIRARCLESEKALRKQHMIRLCPAECPHLYPKEVEQDQDSEGRKPPHICRRYGDRVMHDGNHPRLVMLDKCDLWGEA